jgi:hypothetical protein
MSDGRHRFFLALSWLWVAAVIGYMIWGAFAYAGLYRWLAELQLVQWGGYYRKWTAALPGILLSLPALAYIGHRTRVRGAAEAASPVAQARTIGRTARYTMVLGLVGMLIGGGAFAISLTLPDGSEPAAPIDGARLGSGPAPAAKVRIRGTDDPSARIQYLQRGADERIIFHAGFRLDGEGKDAPLRLFIERNAPGPEALTTLQAFLPEQTGYLVENGLPEGALAELRGRGLQVASPHYVLRTGDLARREPYHIVAAVAGFTGLVCLLVGFAGSLQARRRTWLATAIRPDGRPVEGAPPAA